MYWKRMSVGLHNLKEEWRGWIEMFHYVIISLSEGKAREKECYSWELDWIKHFQFPVQTEPTTHAGEVMTRTCSLVLERC